MLDDSGSMAKQLSRHSSHLGLLVVALAASAACVERKPTTDEEIAAALEDRARSRMREPPRDTKRWAPPSGLMLAVLAGQGAGPIRLGASVAAVERLMDRPCEIKSETLCRYVARGMDFHLMGGILQSIHVQRAGRPAGRGHDGTHLEFGFFKGMIPPDLRLGMTPEAIQEYLGKPDRVEKVPEPNPQNTVFRHHYPGLVAEYDRWPETGKLILGGVRVIKDARLSPFGVVDARDAGGADAGAGDADAGDAGAGDAGTPAPGDAGAPAADAGPARWVEPR